MQLNTYRQYLGRKWLALGIALVAVLASALWSISAGSAGLSVGDILHSLVHPGTDSNSVILWNVRLPRAAAALVIGMGLAVSGCVMQNVLRNPMASASTLGVSQGACFGAAVGIVFFEGGVQVGNTTANFTVTNPTVVSLFAFLGGMTTTAVIIGLSRVRRASPDRKSVV